MSSDDLIFKLNWRGRITVLTGAEINAARPPHELIHLAEEQFARHLNLNGLHGQAHWNAVLENGLLLAKMTGADPKVAAYFSIFHDCCRWDNGYDPQHGSRAADYLLAIRDRIPLAGGAFQQLVEACRWHNHPVNIHADITVMACWDADRLNLLRVGIGPDPKRLCTDAARHPEVIKQANRRAKNMRFPWE